MTKSETVPFGKYKGRPVEDMLADADYMRWLEAQPWFRERFAHLRQREAEALSSTPEHNRLQALFLKPAYCLAFANVGARDVIERVMQSVRNDVASEIRTAIAKGDSNDKWAEKLDDDARRSELARDAERARTLAAELKRESITLLASAMFEQKGADVLISLGASHAYLHNPSWSHGLAPMNTEVRRRQFLEPALHVEIKPSVADDYPAVLRQMNRNGSVYLFTVEYTGVGASREDFIQMFHASGKRVVFKSDVDAVFATISASGG